MEKLAIDSLLNDPRYTKGKELLLEALQDAQKVIQNTRPASEDRISEYQNCLDRFKQARGNPLYYPYIGSGIGNGPLVELLDGSIKYDLISGIGPHYFGHSNLYMTNVCIDSALCDTVMEGNLQQNKDALELMELLIEQSQCDHCFLSTSGAMACENALKIAFQKRHPANRILAFNRAFAGRSTTLSQITDKPQYRQGLPSTLFVDYIPFFDHARPDDSIEEAKHILLQHLHRHPGEYAVMCLELVQGEGGFYAGTERFFKEIIQILRHHSVLVWVDEVQTFARTTHLFASQYYNIQDAVDIITIGKVSQVCATLYKKDLNPKPGLLSQTFTGSVSAIRSARFIISHALKHTFFGKGGKIDCLHQAFVKALDELHAKFPHSLKGPYGLGSMIAFTPLNGEQTHVEAFCKKLFDNGVIGFTAGSHPTRIRFLLPVGSIEISDIVPIMDIIEKTLIDCQERN